MSKSDFWFFMATWAIAEDEKRKRAETQRQRQENKNVLQQIHRRNVSRTLGQHRYVSFKRSRTS